MIQIGNKTLAVCAAAILSVYMTLSVQATELLMFEQAGCSWCEVWDKEIGGIYDKTAEGQAAPLRRLNIHDPLPKAFSGLKQANFTPTFVIWHEGREVGRIRGYPGEHFFWPMLQDILKKADPTLADAWQPAPKS